MNVCPDTPSFTNSFPQIAEDRWPFQLADFRIGFQPSGSLLPRALKNNYNIKL